MRDRVTERGVLRWMTADEIADNRRARITRLHNNEGRRIVYTSSESTDKSIGPVDRDAAGNALIEKPAPLKPRGARETTDLMAQIVAKHMLTIKEHDPEAFRRKLADLRASTGTQYAHWTDDQLSDRIVEVCRVAVAEPTVRRVVGRQGNRMGGWKS